MSSGALSSKFPVYQIDFAATAAGKRVASTKRRIQWRFGFPNKQALDEGRTGTDCRGEEHDIVVIWSITSGKRQIQMDNREIHYSSSRAGLLDFSWTAKGNHVIKVVCHAAGPLTPIPGFRQYDLYVDGQSFFTMPKVYELGLKGSAPSHARVAGGFSNPTSPISMDSGYPRSVGNDYVPASRDQEEADLRRAIQASLEESRRHLEGRSSGAPTGAGGRSVQTEADLLDFGSPPPSGPPNQPPSDARSVSGMSYYSAPPSYSQQPPYGSPAPYQSPQAGQPPVGPGALVPSHGPGGYYQAPPPSTPSYGSPPPVPPAPAPTPQTYYGAPPTNPQMNYANSPAPPSNQVFGYNSNPMDDPFAPKPPPPPPQQDFASMILGAYQNSPQPTTPTAGGTPQQNGGSPYTPQSNGGGGYVQSMQALAVTAEEEQGPVNELEKAMRNLVNIDHIDEPAEGEIKLTMVKKEEAKKKQAKGKSVPLPPVARTVVGSGATLAQIKEVKVGVQERTLKDTADGVMQAPPPGVFTSGAAAAGALVVHGQGPPPLHQPMGFGLGARLPNGGFAHQQQTPPMGYQQQYR